MSRSIFALGAAIIVTTAHGQVVDFEDAPGSNNPIYNNTALVLGDFEFISTHLHTLDTFNIFNGIAQNGSDVYIGNEGSGLGGAITMTRTDGGAFNVFSLDAAELWVGDNATWPNAWGVSVTGYFQGGGSITDVLELDGLVDGAGGVADFQTFSLSGFTNLVAFEFNGVESTGAPDRAFGVDNINLVPTPGAIMVAGLGGLLGVRRRR